MIQLFTVDDFDSMYNSAGCAALAGMTCTYCPSDTNTCYSTCPRATYSTACTACATGCIACYGPLNTNCFACDLQFMVNPEPTLPDHPHLYVYGEDRCNTCGDGYRFDTLASLPATFPAHIYADAVAWEEAYIEECDDGNQITGDGCDQYCDVEFMWTCAGKTPDTCVFSCITNTNPYARVKLCDDGTGLPEDGCTGDCIVRDGWTCCCGTDTTADTCTEICGDGMGYGNYACDDGNTVSGDGCSATCTLEPNWSCNHGTLAWADICW